MRTVLILFVCAFLYACEGTYEGRENLSTQEYQQTLEKLAPYVISKSDEFSFDERFLPQNKPFYDKFLQLTGGELTYFKDRDTASFFFFRYKDLTSLYEHYRGLGGYFRTNDKNEITFLNLLYHTPRLTKQEMDERGRVMFEEMVKNGNIKSHLGNKQFVHAPNDDFYYNTKLNRWDYTENSSWKFLEEARQQAQRDSIR
jgi:hypothetical protein